MAPRQERDRIVIPTHFRSHVAKYAMKKWFDKNCPGRERLLAGVPAIYKELVVSAAGESGDTAIERADTAALDAVAGMLAHCINRELSLVEHIESHNQDFPAEPEKWYSICCAAGWLVIQTYFRERVSQDGGE